MIKPFSASATDGVHNFKSTVSCTWSRRRCQKILLTPFYARRRLARSFIVVSHFFYSRLACQPHTYGNHGQHRRCSPTTAVPVHFWVSTNIDMGKANVNMLGVTSGIRPSLPPRDRLISSVSVAPPSHHQLSPTLTCPPDRLAFCMATARYANPAPFDPSPCSTPRAPAMLSPGERLIR